MRKNKTLLAVLSGIVMFTGCASAPRVTGPELEKIQGVTWVYQTPNPKQYFTPEYIQLFHVTSSDKIDESQVQDADAARLDNCLSKARMKVGTALVNMLAPGVSQAERMLTGKASETKVYVEKMSLRLPYFTPKDVQVGFTAQQGCYYIGALPKESLMNVLGTTFSGEISNYVKDWLNKEFDSFDLARGDQLLGENVAKKEDNTLLLR